MEATVVSLTLYIRSYRCFIKDDNSWMSELGTGGGCSLYLLIF